ncbi:MAG: GNAT family N-acetyltransferase [Bacteroidota bacterium]
MQITTTKRLSIELVTLADSSFFFKLLNSPNWLEFIGDRGIKSEADAVNYIQKNIIDSYNIHGYGFYKLVSLESKIAIGMCGFKKRDYLENADIGYAILPKYEGQGYTSEAAKAIVDYGFNVLQLNPILAITTAKNTASKNLLRKIGLKEIGIIKPNEVDVELLLFSKANHLQCMK